MSSCAELPWVSACRRKGGSPEEQAGHMIELFAVSVLYVDHYVDEARRPVIRVFGRRPTGQSALVHVHGCFPYLFVKAGPEPVKRRALLHASIEASRFRGIVESMSLCRGIDFYGFRADSQANVFIKIEVREPTKLKGLGEFLQSGQHALGLCLQPYETHVPYMLQFLSDYELSGMATLRLGDFEKVPAERRQVAPGGMETEVDAHVADILVGHRAPGDRRPGGSRAGADVSMVPSLQAWLDDLELYVFEADSEPVSRSASMTSQRVASKGDASVLEGLRTWLDTTCEGGSAGDGSGPKTVSSQEALDLLKSFEKSRGAASGSPGAEELAEAGWHSSDDEEADAGLDAMTQADLQKWDESLSASAASESEERHSEQYEQQEADGQVRVHCDSALQAAKRRRLDTLRSLVASPGGHSGAGARSPHNTGTTGSSFGVSPRTGRVRLLRPREEPPAWYLSEEPLKNFCKHQPPYFSDPHDAALERKHSGRRAPRALVPTSAKQAGTGAARPARVFLAPRESPPTWAEVRRDLGAAGQGGCGTIVEGVDVGTRQLADKKEAPNLATFRVMMVEVIGKSTHAKLPNPAQDAVLCILALTYEDSTLVDSRYFFDRGIRRKEADLLHAFAEHVTEVDPDAIAGWEVQRKSLGYILKRATQLGLDTFAAELSRVPKGPQDPRHLADSYGSASYSEYWLAGRHVFNLWRIVRKEINLPAYSLEDVVQRLLKRPLPKFSGYKLYDLFMRRNSRHVALDYLTSVVEAAHEIVMHLDIYTKTGEFSKLLGLDLFSTLTRGSQFQVEGVMIRVAKPLNYVMPSPSREQVATQPPLEFIALNLEPQSAMYSDPVAVLDFRSLYPSVVIAYNLCFSTFVGRLTTEAGEPRLRFEAGAFLQFPNDRGGYPTHADLRGMLDAGSLRASPSGAIFVAENVRRGVLPRMLSAILSTRFAIKDGIKKCKRDGRPEWCRVLDARQLALKMLANVTYGYTAASFSGRMPMAALADAIVSIGKGALEGAMSRAVSEEAPWASHCPRPLKVVYGDTDSLFLVLGDCHLRAAFKIARWVASDVTQGLPAPMKLQMEKVYLPSMLVAKKRYCGLKFEDPDGTPRLESKGLETIRRDSCPIMQRVMTDLVLSVFQDRDLSKTKRLFCAHMNAILEGRVPVNQFVFASKVRVPIDQAYRGPSLPPSAAVAQRQAKLDPMLMPVHKERVRYVIVNGAPGSRLVDLVAPPTPASNINALYYIKHKLLQPLNRMFRLMRVDVFKWYAAMRKAPSTQRLPPGARRTGLYQHFRSRTCFTCGARFAEPVQASAPAAPAAGDALAGEGSERVRLCAGCQARPQATALALALARRECERERLAVERQCQACTGELGLGEHCENRACPVNFRRVNSSSS